MTPIQGYSYWRINRGPAKAGAVAGHIDQRGYVWIQIKRIPRKQIDHKNGNTSDNCIENLRECSNAENGQNYGLRKNNTSGITGVSWSSERRKWSVCIRINGKVTALGRFEKKEEAHAAYLAAKQTHHKFQPIPREIANGKR